MAFFVKDRGVGGGVDKLTPPRRDNEEPGLQSVRELLRLDRVQAATGRICRESLGSTLKS